jgi:uncharacterized membrane protein YgcG
MPAAITALVGLATAAVGAAGALAGIGVLGAAGVSLAQTGQLSMAPIREEFADVADSFVDAFEPIATALAPTFRSAVDSLQLMAGPLATASTELLAMRDVFSGFVNFLTRSIPSFTQEFLAFTQAAMPVISSFGRFLANIDVFGVFADTIRSSLPFLAILGTTLKRLAPLVVEISKGFLAVATTLLKLISIGVGLLNVLDKTLFFFIPLRSIIGLVAGALLTLISVVTLAKIAMTGATGAALSWIFSMESGLIPTLQKVIAANTAWNITLAQTVALVTILTGGLLFVSGIVLPKLIDQFDLFGSSIANARKELGRFSATQSSFDVGGGGVGGGRAEIYNDNSTTVINAGSRDSAARQRYSNEFERRQQVDSVFGSG